ncbi:3'-5' exonuclease [Chloroflexi bacterium TSY]|nr:3'-5' exonuclease [Chloroflexi bacterium TSY]
MDQINISDATYIILDFETITYKGYPPEPVELGAIRISSGLVVDPDFQVSQLISPPIATPITLQHASNMGLRVEDFQDQPSVQEVLACFERKLGAEPYLIVAHNASYDISLIRRYSTSCPGLIRMPVLDSVRLARTLLSGLRGYGLDGLADHFDLPIPVDRHRALPDVQLTCMIFIRLLRIWLAQHKDQRVYLLRQAAGIKEKPMNTQQSFFD